eukprot:SAG31_NODE_27552_length_424_cov_0.790769_1_plen_62_part_01
MPEAPKVESAAAESDPCNQLLNVPYSTKLHSTFRAMKQFVRCTKDRRWWWSAVGVSPALADA